MAARKKAKKKAEEKAEKYPTFTTEIGTLTYPHLNEARDYKGDGKFAYDCKFVLTGQAAADFEKQIDEWVEESCTEHGTKRKNAPPYDIALDENKEEIEGATAFKFKVKASVETRKGTWDRRPTFFDSTGTPIVDVPLLGSGTKARINFTIYRWKNPNGASVSLQPKNVQIIELVEYVPRGQGETPEGFGAIKDGFVAKAGAEGDGSDEGADPRGF
jgi:hypothetical protein